MSEMLKVLGVAQRSRISDPKQNEQKYPYIEVKI